MSQDNLARNKGCASDESTLPPASNRYCTDMSIGPWPISVFPFHVPTSDFSRSNSGECHWLAGFPFSASDGKVAKLEK